MTKHLLFICLFAVSIFGQRAMAQCSAPINLSASYNNNVSTFTWDTVPGAIDYTFELKFHNSNTWAALSNVVTTNSFSYTGLWQTQNFDWRVKTNCGSAISAYSTVQAYATPCPEPNSLSVTNITGTTVTLNWVAAVGYKTTVSDFVVSYRLANTTNAWTSLGHTSVFTINVSGLQSNTAYEWCVNQSCTNGLSNPVLGQFATAYVACDIPTNLSITNATSNTAQVSWANVIGGLTYSVETKPATGSVWSAPVVINNNNVILSGLLPSTLYDCRVKSNCTSTSSAYVSKQFTTYAATCTAWGNNSSEFIDLFSLGSINRTSGKETGGYFFSGQSTTLLIGSTTNAGQFSAGYNPGITFGDYYAVYIDFNRNGTFTDAGERVVNPVFVASGSAIFNFNIAIPNTATAGVCKMRVVICRNNATIAPCATNFRGEAEDYNVVLATSSLRLAANGTQNNLDNSTSNFAVYPNPSAGIYTVEMPENTSASWYAVYSLNGSMIEKQNVNSNKFEIDLSNNSNGIYLLNVYSNEANKIITQKLQLNK